MKPIYKEYCTESQYHLVRILKPIKYIVNSFLQSNHPNFFKKEFRANKLCNYAGASYLSDTAYLLKINNTYISSVFRIYAHYEYAAKSKNIL